MLFGSNMSPGCCIIAHMLLYSLTESARNGGDFLGDKGGEIMPERQLMVLIAPKTPMTIYYLISSQQ